MKRQIPNQKLSLFVLLFLMIACSAVSQAKTKAVATWVSGSDTTNNPGVYGTLGVPNPANIPGARWGSFSWKDDTGNFWLFGGLGYDSTGAGEDELNDLWKFDGTNWTWISGSDTTNNPGVYGTLGVPAPANIPGARSGGLTWTDDTGNLWLFGGWGFDSAGNNGVLNDLWKFDSGQWTWISGSDTRNNPGIYGTLGVPDPANIPGARWSSFSWTDDAGNLWLFGGVGFDIAGSLGELNDLWKFDGTNWTWVSGSDTTNNPGVYGTLGLPDPANIPGAREGGLAWTDDMGNQWLFGGSGRDSAGIPGRLNDLWKFDGTNWTWVSGSDTTNNAGIYGTLGIPEPANIPGARRYSISWTDEAGNQWLYGGRGYDSAGNHSELNDLWKFDGTNWTWVNGSDTVNNPGIYGTLGAPDPVNIPGARDGGISWTDDEGNLWLFGGYGYDSAGNNGDLNDLWKFEIYESYDLIDFTDFASAWSSEQGDPAYDPACDVVIPLEYSIDILDLQVFCENWLITTTTIATWISGSNTVDNLGIYGTMGIPDPANIPGARWGSLSWTDDADNLWLFGGTGFDSAGTGDDELNDLWKYDGTNWTWVSGSDTTKNPGVYGTLGVPDPANIPGARAGGFTWTDDTGNFWLFGGHGYDSTGTFGNLNDLWKYDGANWTWISGSDTRNNPGVYGTLGIPDAANVPGARSGGLTWTDDAGNLWLFGGYGHDSADTLGNLNDLWKFDSGQWTWVSGSDTTNNPGVYGTLSVPDSANVPGARWLSLSWTDNAGDLWLFGGTGYDGEGNLSELNDLWKFESGQWTWVSGSDTVNNPGVYGTLGVPDPANVPGARSGSISWTDDAGNLWLFGGYGRDSAGIPGRLNDLWKFDGTNWTWITGSDIINNSGVYGTLGVPDPSNIPGARSGSISWTDDAGKLWLFSGYGRDSAGTVGFLNDLWKFEISQVYNLRDFTQFASTWRCVDTDPDYDPAYDLVTPEVHKIDILDLCVFCERWLAGP
jgi:N-acetylneuraminic acid mutarotase